MATPRKLPAEKKKTGRPSTFTPAIGNRICSLIAHGKSLRTICAEHGLDRSVVNDWLRKDTAFASQYARAREDQADFYAEEGLQITDEAQGKPSEVVAAARLRWDARRWYASKLAPKRYGDKTEVEHSGGVRVVSVAGSDADLV